MTNRADSQSYTCIYHAKREARGMKGLYTGGEMGNMIGNFFYCRHLRYEGCLALNFIFG